MMREPKAFLFDLDGVLTDTSEFHYLAWKEIADQLNLKFDQKDNERLKGVSRRRSFEIILEINYKELLFSEEQIENITNKKNEIYCKMIDKIIPENILDGVIHLLEQAKNNGMLLAVASASKNAQIVIEHLEIGHYFDFIADASKIKNTKPNPEVFEVCAKKLGVPRELCIGFEDSQAGIEAIHAAGMFSVGIGVEVSSIRPHYVLQRTAELNYSNIIQEFKKWNQA